MLGTVHAAYHISHPFVASHHSASSHLSIIYQAISSHGMICSCWICLPVVSLGLHASTRREPLVDKKDRAKQGRKQETRAASETGTPSLKSRRNFLAGLQDAISGSSLRKCFEYETRSSLRLAILLCAISGSCLQSRT